jgi:hypothetical protein
MENHPGVLEAPITCGETIAHPGTVETIPELFLEQWWHSLEPSGTFLSSEGYPIAMGLNSVEVESNHGLPRKVESFMEANFMLSGQPLS